MSTDLPFLPEGAEDNFALAVTLNELSTLSKILSQIAADFGKHEHLKDFFRLLYIISESAAFTSESEQVGDETRIANRFINRFGRTPPLGMVHKTVYYLTSGNWIAEDNGRYLVTDAGNRMMAYLFYIIRENYFYHQLDDLGKVEWRTRRAGLMLDASQELGTETEHELRQYARQIIDLCRTTKKNVDVLLRENRAHEAIDAISRLLEASIARIREYVDNAKCIEDIDSFRMRNRYINMVLLEANNVRVNVIGGLFKALEISATEINRSPINESRFQQELYSKLRQSFAAQDDSSGNVYENLILMADRTVPIAMVPCKPFGGISSVDILGVVSAWENNEIGFSQRSSSRIQADAGMLESVPYPEEIPLSQMNLVDGDAEQERESSMYDLKFQEMHSFVLEHGDEERTIQDWIMRQEEPNCFCANVFLDFMSYLIRLGLCSIDDNARGNPQSSPQSWRFVRIADNPNLLTGEEMLRLPVRELLEEYNQESYGQQYIARKKGETNG